MSNVIGIDLGTTNTAVCAIVDGRPKMLENAKGYSIFPSAVFIDESGEVLVGHKAKTAQLTAPQRGVYAVKRLMGLRYDSPKVQQVAQNVSYAIQPNPAGECSVEYGSLVETPVEIAARILAEAKNVAEQALGGTVSDAVITVPAHFNHRQRSQTKEAAEKAGLRCDRIINEPTAAALAYGYRKDASRMVMVYDLGGGTFDISLLQYDVGLVETLATRGDTFLGGEDFDSRLVAHLAEQFIAEHQFDVREDEVAHRRLRDAAERAKCELSFREKTSVYVPQIHNDISLQVDITRSELEIMCEDLVQRTLDVVKQTLKDAGKKLSDVDEIVLVGGQTRMPRIKQAISQFFNKNPSRGVHPDESVATGAALHASSLGGDLDAPILLDVTPFDLGIDISGGLFEKVITRNAQVPTTATKRFNTARINQSSVKIVVRQGESRVAEENEFLGEFFMTGLIPGKMGTAAVDVMFKLDSNGILRVEAVDLESNEKADIIVRNYGQFAKNMDGNIPLQVDANNVSIDSPSPEQNTQGTLKTSPGIQADDAAAIEQKAGFFSNLFGSNKSRGEDELIPAESDVMASAPEEVEPIEVDVDGILDFDDDDLFDLIDEEETVSPAVVGMADSSSAASESDPLSGDMVDDLPMMDDLEIFAEPIEDDAVSELLFEGIEDPEEPEESADDILQDIELTDLDIEQESPAIEEEVDIMASIDALMDELEPEPIDPADELEASEEDDDEFELELDLDEPNETVEDAASEDGLSDEIDDELEDMLSQLEAGNVEGDLSSSQEDESPEGTIEDQEVELDLDIELDLDFDAFLDDEEPNEMSESIVSLESTSSETMSDAVSLESEEDVANDFVESLDVDDLLDLDLDLDLDSLVSNSEEEQEAMESNSPAADLEDALELDLSWAERDEGTVIIEKPNDEPLSNHDETESNETLSVVSSEVNEESDSEFESNEKGEDAILDKYINNAKGFEFDLPDDNYIDTLSRTLSGEPVKAVPKPIAPTKIEANIEDDDALEIPTAPNTDLEEDLDFLDDLFDD